MTHEQKEARQGNYWLMATMSAALGTRHPDHGYDGEEALREALQAMQRPPATRTFGPEYYATRIDCAAVKSTDGQVWTGKRHSHCFATIKQAGLRPSQGEQGFVTLSGRFVTRREAAELVTRTGQCKVSHPPDLCSEDLY